MGVLFGRFAVRGPSSMPDPDRPGEEFFFQRVFQVQQFADASSNLDPAMLQHGDPRGIIASILQTLQALYEHISGVVIPDIAYNSTHRLFVTLTILWSRHERNDSPST